MTGGSTRLDGNSARAGSKVTRIVDGSRRQKHDLRSFCVLGAASQRNMDTASDLPEGNILAWSVNDVNEFLRRLGLAQYEPQMLGQLFLCLVQ